MVSRRAAILALGALAMAVIFSATASAGPTVLVINTPENPVPVDIMGTLDLDFDDSNPLAVSVQGSVEVDDEDPVDVEVIGAVSIDSATPVGVAVQGDIGVDDTDPVDVEVMGTVQVEGVVDVSAWLHTTRDLADSVYIYSDFSDDWFEFDTRGYRAITFAISSDVEATGWAEWVIGAPGHEMFVYVEEFELTGSFPGTTRTYDVQGHTLNIFLLALNEGEEGNVDVTAYLTT